MHHSFAASPLLLGLHRQLFAEFVCAVLFAGLLAGQAAAQNETEPAGETAAQPENLQGDSAAESTVPMSQKEMELFDITRELIDQSDLQTFRQEQVNRRFLSVYTLRDRRSAETDRIVREWIRVKVYSMTLKENRRKVAEVKKEILDRVEDAGSRENNDQARRDFRMFVMDEVLKRARDLLDNNYEVRLNAVVLISQLNVTEPGPNNRPPGEAYSPAMNVLLKDVLQSESQPLALKIAALAGMKRNALLGSPPHRTTLKNEIIRSLVNELEYAKKMRKGPAATWYQTRLLETLAAVDLPVTAEGEPVIVKTLESFLEDETRPLSVRCVAAKSLGKARLTQHSEVKTDELALKLGKLGLELANGYDRNRKAYHFWQKCFWDLYAAFRPEGEQDKLLYEASPPPRRLGLLAKYPGRQDIQDAYDQIRPLISHVLKQPETRGGQRGLWGLPESRVEELKKWIASHPAATSNSLVDPADNTSTATVSQ